MSSAPLPIRPSLAILVLCSAVQPFALNVLAPATPAIARSLGTDYGTIQLTLTLYLAAVALSRTGTLWSYTENHYAPPPPYPPYCPAVIMPLPPMLTTGMACA